MDDVVTNHGALFGKNTAYNSNPLDIFHVDVAKPLFGSTALACMGTRAELVLEQAVKAKDSSGAAA